MSAKRSKCKKPCILLTPFLTTEDELMRIVNFYNRFDAPYQACFDAGERNECRAHSKIA